MVFVAVEVLPVGSKLPAASSERISKTERHNLGAQRRCLPGLCPLNKKVPEVRFSHHRRW